jgi:hypothetical protein
MTDRPLRLRSSGLSWREVEGEIVALDLNTSAYIGINASGAALWPELAAGTTRDQLVRRLCESFGLERATAEHDVDAFVGALLQQGLLEP